MGFTGVLGDVVDFHGRIEPVSHSFPLPRRARLLHRLRVGLPKDGNPTNSRVGLPKERKSNRQQSLQIPFLEIHY